ncbi:hypothetical protein L6303_01545 [archaeon]|nr:hypothetical protein [Nanoarchaeota archaeon]MBU4300453.1 hypothetical protein [Nanoarchaeota archaeon]MBU4451668.1 hypothetical protein [Nanoarchaeota archaeon]MCG2723402.1 hypothetical protein [archaeon]
MKKISTIFSAIFGLILIGNLVSADMSISMIPNPVTSIINSTTTATVHVNSSTETNVYVYIDSWICKDTNGNRNTCEGPLLSNGGGEIKVTFANNLFSSQTDSSGNAGLKIALGPGADAGANYLFKIRANNGGWQEAVVTGESNAVPIPEFPTSAAPVILSMLSIGLVRMKYK